MTEANEEHDDTLLALQKSEAKFRILAESGVIGVHAWDMDGRFTWVNDAFLKISGYTREDLDTGILRWDHMTPPEWKEATNEAMRQLRETGKFVPYEKEFLAKDGRRIPVMLGGSLLDEGTSGISYVIDLTELKQTKETIEQERERFRSLVEGLGAGLMMTDVDDVIQYANPRMSEITGYSPKQLLGMKVIDLLANSGELESVLHDRYKHAAHTAESYDIEISRRDGTKRWLEVHAVPYLDKSKEIVGLLTTNTDITERVIAEKAHIDSERRLRLALEGGSLGWWHLDVATGTFLEFSAKCRAHFGLAPEEHFDLDGFHSCVHPDDRANVDDATRQALTGTGAYYCEYRVIWPDKSIHWICAHGAAIIEREIGSLRFIGVTQDITERKALELVKEKALKEAQDRADRDPLTNLLNHRAFHKRFEEEANRCRSRSESMAVVILDINNFKFFNDVYSHAIGDEVLLLVAKSLRSISRPYDILARFGGDEFVLLLTNIGSSTDSEIQERILAGVTDITYFSSDEESGIPITLSVGAAVYPGSSEDRLEVLRQADERMKWHKTGGTTEAEARAVRTSARAEVKGFSMLDALVVAVDNKDRYTRRHSEDVMGYSLMIARELGMEDSEQHDIAIAALIHDIGKIGVPDYILRKPGILSDEEFETIKQHPEMGAVIVAAIPGLEHTLDAIRHHHEHWNGIGYPYGLVGNSIPRVARLMAVADAFSAMTTDRPYRKGMDAGVALKILETGSGVQWDPECVEAFLRAYKFTNAVDLSSEQKSSC